MEPWRDLDPASAVVVPVRPGPVVELRGLTRTRDEVDDVLDEVFGTPDDRGPGPVDALLVAGGLAALVAGLAGAAGTVVVVGGVAALALGSVLPIRSVSRRLGAMRRGRRVRALIGDGLVLRTDHPSVRALLAAEAAVRSARVAPATFQRSNTIAHAAVYEVASLLAGRSPATDDEVAYVDERARALRSLADALTDPQAGDDDADRRRSLVEARREVERIDGASSVTDAERLRMELLGDDA